MNADMQWIVEDPFPGHCQSYLTNNGVVAYTNGLTFEQLCERDGKEYRLVSDAEFDRMVEEYAQKSCTKPTPETEEQWWYALEVLPPCRWHHQGNVELFHISERITLNLVNWHAKIGDQYFTFVERDSAKSEMLADMVRRAVE